MGTIVLSARVSTISSSRLAHMLPVLEMLLLLLLVVLLLLRCAIVALPRLLRRDWKGRLVGRSSLPCEARRSATDGTAFVAMVEGIGWSCPSELLVICSRVSFLLAGSSSTSSSRRRAAATRCARSSKLEERRRAEPLLMGDFIVGISNGSNMAD